MVSQIGGTGSPEETELFQLDTVVAYLAKLHVHSFGTSWLDMTVDHAFGSGIVGLDGG